MGIKNAYFAGGCFWGVEYFFENYKGVKSAISGYMGGHVNNPTYREVCSGETGHLEVVQVEYNELEVSFEELVKLFFETHDFTQEDGQGPDIGSQYLSAIFYNNDNEKIIIENIIAKLEDQGFNVATQLISTKNTPFFKAENYHQDYYFKTGKEPYCHSYKKIF